MNITKKQFVTGSILRKPAYWERFSTSFDMGNIRLNEMLSPEFNGIDLSGGQFQRLAEGKCAVVVTHRLGSVKLARRVVVMDAGEIVDIGTHDELLSRPGKYTDMWTAQAQCYERSDAASIGTSG